MTVIATTDEKGENRKLAGCGAGVDFCAVIGVAGDGVSGGKDGV